MTHEEEVVRTTYAKLSFADEIRILVDGISKNRKAEERSLDRELNSRLDFQLQNFKVGPLKEIFGRTLVELSGFVEGDDVLDVTPGTYIYHTDRQPINEYLVYAQLKWRKASAQLSR